MKIRAGVVLALSLVMLAALLPTADASPAAAPGAGWTEGRQFIDTEMILSSTLRAEVAADGASMITFTRTGYEGYCGRARTRVRTPDSPWKSRKAVRASDQTHLVAGDQLAWIGELCSGGIELHYADADLWREPAYLPASVSALRAGMNGDGLVAFGRPSGPTVLVDTARPGEDWTPAPTLSTPTGIPVVDHVAVTDDDQIIVVWHVSTEMVVSTLDDGRWSSVPVPGDHDLKKVYAASDRFGNVTIARVTTSALLYVSFRASDGSVSDDEQVASGLDYECIYTCAAVDVLPGGGRRDAADGTWTTEVVDPAFRPVTARLDAHEDDTLVLTDSSLTRVWICSWTDPCAVVAYPPGTDHGAFAAGRGGAMVAVAGRSECDDWCDFSSLGGYRYRPGAMAGDRRR